MEFVREDTTLENSFPLAKNKRAGRRTKRNDGDMPKFSSVPEYTFKFSFPGHAYMYEVHLPFSEMNGRYGRNWRSDNNETLRQYRKWNSKEEAHRKKFNLKVKSFFLKVGVK